MTRVLLWLIGFRAVLVALAVVLVVVDRLPWWFAALVVVREVAMGAVIALRRLRSGGDPVAADPVAPSAVGLLLVGLALIAAASGDGSPAVLARVFGWAAAWWGLGLSWAGVAGQARDLQRLLARRPDRAGRS